MVTKIIQFVKGKIQNLKMKAEIGKQDQAIVEGLFAEPNLEIENLENIETVSSVEFAEIGSPASENKIDSLS